MPSTINPLERPCTNHEYRNNPGNVVDRAKEQKCLLYWKNYAHELFFFCYMFTLMLTSIPITKLFMKRACLIELNLSPAVCHKLNNDQELLNKVQVIANDNAMYLKLISAVPTTLLSVFIGHWSDKYGRKPLMYVSLIGAVLQNIGMVWYTSAETAPIYQALLVSIISGATGSSVSIVSSVYALAAEQTDAGLRTHKYATLEISVVIATPLGALAASYITDYLGFIYVFSIGLGCHVLLVFCLFFLISDEEFRSRALVTKKALDFFSCENFKENFRTILKKRENCDRAKIWLLIFSIGIIVASLNSIGNILYLFCNKMFGWPLSEFTLAYMMGTVARILALVVSTHLLIRRWKIPDTWLGILGVCSLMAESVIQAFSYYSWIFYLSLATGILAGLSPSAARSRLSKTVEEHELGKVFAMVATVENLSHVIGALVFGVVYRSSIKLFPGLTFLVDGLLLLLPLLVFLWLMCQRKPRRKAMLESYQLTVISSNGTEFWRMW